MAAGLKYCDRALTVSPSYAVECCTDPEKGAEATSVWRGVVKHEEFGGKKGVPKSMLIDYIQISYCLY